MPLKTSWPKIRRLLTGIVLTVGMLVESAAAAPCDLKNNAPAFIRHDLSASYCELCGYGYVTVTVANPYEGVDMTGLTLVEDLRNSGLTFAPAAPTPVRYSVNGGPLLNGGMPAVSGTNGSILTFTSAQIPQLSLLRWLPSNNSFTTVAITFAVQRAAALTDEGLISADRRIEGRLTYSTGGACFPGTTTVTTGLDILPLQEPVPSVTKRGRNADASQSSSQYSATVYGNVNDDVIWRIQVRNSGLADLQDLRFDDLMGSGNLVVNWACPSEAAATQIVNANGVGPGSMGCVAASNTISNFDVDNPFGNPGNDSPDRVDVREAQSAYIYLVGKVPAAPNGSCSFNRTNTVSDIQWGCQSDPPAGGISATSTGFAPANASATLSTLAVNSGNNLNIQTEIIGTNLSQPAGSKGTVRITIRNTTGGTVKSIRLQDILPPEYVVDSTFTPTVTMTPAYGAYLGMTDRIEWLNPVPGTFPLTTTDPALALANTAPQFRLYSSSVHPYYPDQFDLLRHGDRLVISFRIVLIRPQSYDKVANLDVRTEAPNSDPPGTDPANAIALTNQLYVDFQDFCEPGVIKHPPTYPLVTSHQSNPEDLDINIAGSELVFILTSDPAQRLPLTVNLTNHGGHDAADYEAYITFGATMNVVTVPAGCALTANPPPLSIWQVPASIPPGAAVYRYAGPPIAPGQTVALTFEVIKSTDPADLAADDLTFRADVVGEIRLSSGAPLWFPTPINPRADGGIDRANNYSLDGIRARVIGFNLLKSQVGTCSENNPPPGSPDRQVQIGEECTFHIDTGGWFGFQTPGFTYIAVQDIVVFDQLPDGQGYISSTDPYAASTSAIQGVSLNPAALTPLDEVVAPGWMNWAFNQQVPAQRITEKDHWFRVDMTSRLLNDPLNLRAAPNQHAALSTNTLTSDFQAVFYNDVTNQEEIYNLGPGTVGYPRVEVRRLALTVTEPLLSVVKEVCNESLYGAGPACSNFVPLAADGDAYNAYLYRLVISNEAQRDGVTRAPAYDVTVTDSLDASDLAYILPLSGDGLDNDGDGFSGAADTDGEGTISDNMVRNGVPAVITFAYTHSSALRRIDPGQSVHLYYRVDFDDDAAPLQTFTNVAGSSYDSLEGVSGNQSAPQGLNGEKGGARVYASPTSSAAVRIIPVETRPKRIEHLSNSPLATGSETQNVSIGEEIEYRLNTLLPVALLRNFVIRDQLPAGLSCSEAPAVDLNAPPYSAAGFNPGGVITPTCSGDAVEWNFGNQRVTTGTAGLGNRFDFEIRFIARVENTAGTNDGDLISNGHPATQATARYIDESDNLVSLDFGQVDVRVREPRIQLTKAFDAATADAGEILTVSVTAANTGTAPAYNLRVLDDLTGRNLTYVGNVGGTHPPTTVDTTLGPNRPIFSWSAPNGIDPGATIRFTFDVRVDTAAQPHEILSNTLQAAWTSLPGQSTALNSNHLIGPDGSAGGLRNGALPNVGDSVNDYEAQAAATLTVPVPALAKIDLDPALIPEIGAHRQFRVEIRLPEGTTADVRLADNLAAAGLSYIMANNAAFDIAYTFQGIASINGAAPGEAAFNAVPADGTGGSALWDIGTVVTQTENDPDQSAVSPLIRIDYYARANNDLDTDTGDTLRNAAALSYRNGETGGVETLTADTAAVTVVEPLLAVTKTVRNVTPGKQPGDPAAGGDRLEYRIAIANSGTAVAYDVNVADTLSPELALDSGFTPTAAIGGTPVGGFVPVPAAVPGGPLVWGRENGDGSLDIPVGGSLILTYQVVVNEAAGALGNSVWVDWTSLENASLYERTGQGCPAWSAPNDYCTGPAVTTTPTVDDTSIVKTIAEDTFDVPPLSTAADAIARVGDTVTYRLALNLRGGLTRNLRVADQLPAGMAFVQVIGINADPSAPYAAAPPFAYADIPAANVPTAGQTGTLLWTIGDVVNSNFGDPALAPFEIIYSARVLPDAGIAHVGTITLTNTAALTYTGAAALSDTAVLTVRQPLINQITKSDRSGRSSPAAIDLTINPADVMQFRLQACNSGQAPAYSLALSDQLASQLDETSIANLVVSVGGTVLAAGSDYVYTPPAARGGSMAFLLNTPVNPGQCLVIDYDIGFYTDFGANQIWHNSATVEAYWSLPAQSGQQYGPVGPATFYMHNVVSSDHPPAKTIAAPASGEVTIGQEIVYHISVPAAVKNAAMQNVVVTDVLNANLEFLGATCSGFTLGDASVPPNQVNLTIDMIPAGQQAVIELRARVRNVAGAQEGVTFANTALYTFVDPDAPGVQGGGSATSAPLRIVEPELTLSKSVVNLSNPGNPPVAGHILRYSLTFSALGGVANDTFADAFDLRIDDTLSLGMVYNGGATVSGAGNTIGLPVIAGDGIAAGQTLRWSLADGNAAIDIAEGSQVTVAYEVRVLDSVLANQTLTNSATAQWTGLEGTSLHERNGTAVPAWNDYFTGPAVTSLTTQDSNTITKTRVTDTFVPGDAVVRIGDIVVYELRLGLQEGTHSDVVLTDTLPQGLVFEGIAAVNGDVSAPYAAVAPFVHDAITADDVTLTGDPAAGPTTVAWNIGTIVNVADGNAIDDFVILYRARVLNDAHPHLSAITLTNTVRLDYNTATGPAAFKTDSESIDLRQPALTVAKSGVAAGGDTVLAAGELVTYTVDIRNTGAAPADDAVLSDTIPLGMRNGAATITVLGIQLLSGAGLPNLAPVYDPATGSATWNFDTGAAGQYTIPAGDTLRIVYQVQADSSLGAGMTLTNQARVLRYYSLDDEAIPVLGGVVGVRQMYGPTNTAGVTFTTATPTTLDKQNPALAAVAVGEPFTYRITVPAAPAAVALHDVRILDDLGASAAVMSFVGVSKISGSQPWTPVNTGSPTSLVIEDPVNGIDIPAGEQIVIGITVVLADVPANFSGLQFANTAAYTYNAVNGDPATQADGGSDTTENLTIVGPDELTLTKSGPASMQVGNPAQFTLDIYNPSTGTAWNPTILDRLPSGATGGMCGAAPTAVSAQIFEADGVTPASPPLIEGTHFTVAFSGAAACEWQLSLLSASGGLPAGKHLIVHYNAVLDGSTENGAELTNYAGVIQWFGADPNASGSSPITYTESLNDGTPDSIDHEDFHTVTAQAPILQFQKRVRNMTSGQNPGLDASPGDTLRYTIEVRNSGPVGLSGVTIRDEVDRLNGSPAFAPGTLILVTVPAGADTTGTSALGGASGTGLIQVGNLTLGAQGEANDSLVLEFDIQLAPVIADGTVVLNQAELSAAGIATLASDDPQLPGDADPTATRIHSAPLFEVSKTAAILAGDPDILMAGEPLRYTLTIRNIGTENAVNVVLRDYTPANTTYVAGSTTLNGASLADPSPGVNPLHTGIAVNAPANPTAGFLQADAARGAASAATVSFVVTVDPGVMDGLVICNQGFVSGRGEQSGPQPEQPSDDPATPIPDDPTCTIVGNLPYLYGHKTVQIDEDLGSPGVVDPGDALRYTIVVSNFGAIPATGVTLTDSVPDNTSYIADSLRLNGVSPGPDGGIFPLAAGFAVQSADGPGAGIVSGGRSATVTFRVRVNPGVPTGTLIRNQGRIGSLELPQALTDADGVPANGNQPTIVVVGAVQLLTVTKEVAVVGGGAADPGAQLEYVIRAVNVASLPAAYVVLTDNLNPPLGDQVTYVADSARLNGSTAGIFFAGGTLTANYGAVYGDLAPGAGVILRFRVQINAGLALGTTITNTAEVHWGSPTQTASASVSIDVGGTPGSTSFNGAVWHDADLDKLCDSTERSLANWSVELYRAGQLVATVTTAENGLYRFSGIVPNAGTGQLYEIRFRAPGAGPNTASMGQADSIFTNGPQRISAIEVASGANIVDLNLPLWPNGTVYNAVVREPVAGASVRLLNAATGTALPDTCFDDPLQQNQVIAADGFYKFDLNFSNGSCPAGGDYLIEVTPPPTGYTAGPSQVIPPASSAATPAFSIPACPGSTADAVPATAEYCEATASALAPPASVPPRTAGTTHYLNLTLGNGHVPGHSQIFNNPIPIDPVLDGAVAITKIAAMVNVTRSALVPYTITVTNILGVPLYDVGIVDRLPPGFKYVEGSARMEGSPLEPRVIGRELFWDGLELQVNTRYTLKFLLVVGSGVAEGEYVNRAYVHNSITRAVLSGEANATVRVVPDPTFDCTDIIGKVFDDRDLDGRQEAGEHGLPGVRVVTARGLIATTDAHGRFHITCAVVPDQDRGSNFILKLDERSLPTGYRLTTENPRVQRATRGKMLRFNFGATIHRVVRIDIADGAFEPDTTELRLQWAPKIDALLAELKKAPSVLSLSYLADVERESLVRERLDVLKEEISRQWNRSAENYRLDIETEVFWRRGAPVGGRR